MPTDKAAELAEKRRDISNAMNVMGADILCLLLIAQTDTIEQAHACVLERRAIAKMAPRDQLAHLAKKLDTGFSHNIWPWTE